MLVRAFDDVDLINNAGEGCAGRLNVFDSFAGLSPFTERDISEFWSTEQERDRIRSHFVSSYDHVSSLVQHFGFVELHRGWIPEVFSGFESQDLSFVSIDVDLYEPTRDAIEYFYPRLGRGGVMYFDDYAYQGLPWRQTSGRRVLESK
jgi:O-methyltransferase